MKRLLVLALTLFTIFIIPTLAFAQGGGWTVLAWYGSPSELADDWQLCDGTNDTPDLRDQFLVGAGNTYALDDTGGAATVDLEHDHMVASHAHSLPSHNHTVANHTHSLPSHRHTTPNHTHSISNVKHDHSHGLPQHSHVIASDTHNHNFVTYDSLANYSVSNSQVGTVSQYGTLLILGTAGGSSTLTRYRRYVTNDSHDHGGVTATNVAATSGSNVWWHDHGGATGSGGASNTGYWSGTSGSNGAGNTGNWSGSSGTASPGTSLELAVTENRPPYTALYYICYQGLITTTPPITTSMLVTDPNTTDYYTITGGVKYSKVRTISLGQEVTNYLLIAILLLGLLQSVIWFIVEGKRKWA